MEILQRDFYEDDLYNRDCTAFKVGWTEFYYYTETSGGK